MSGANTASDLRLFIPLTKVDIERRLVYGVATAEEPDLSGEVCDYATTKPLYEAWSEGVKKASGGKSLGNLRSMHGSTAAGKIMDISFDDGGRKIEICAKVVDDNEWQKVQEGVYTGFSQGGKYLKRWTDEKTKMTHYTADPSEVSLVDLPCLPSATFNVMKAEGLVEKRAFTNVVTEPDAEAIKLEAEALAKAADDGRAWSAFVETATSNIMKAQIGAGLAKLEKVVSNAVEPSVSEGEKNAGKSDVRFEPEQFWSCGCADHKHVAKAEAVKCMKKRATDEAAAQATAPVTDALNKLEETLGIAKAGSSDKKADDGDAKEGDAKSTKAMHAEADAHHAEAASGHRSAAHAHSEMAGYADMTSDEARAHLAAATAHMTAAKKHDAAIGKTDGPESQDADHFSHHAMSATEDSFGVAKALAAEDLAKRDVSDQARDDSGKWTAAGAARVIGHAAVGGIVGGFTGGPLGAAVGAASAAYGSATHPDRSAGWAAVDGAIGGINAPLVAMGGRAAASGAKFAMNAARGARAANAARTAARTAAGWKAATGAAQQSAARAAAGFSTNMSGAAAAGTARLTGPKVAPFAQRTGKAQSAESLQKGLYDVSRFADLLDSLSRLQRSVQREADGERDDSKVPAILMEQIKALSQTLITMVAEETAELFADDSDDDAVASVMRNAAGMSESRRSALIKVSKDVPGLKNLADILEKTQGEALDRTLDRFVTEMQTLAKIGARNSATDASRLQKAHDLLNELGADCAKANGTGDSDEVEKIRDENAALRKTVEDLGSRLTAITDKVAELGKRAAPAKAALRAVEKGEDVADAAAETRSKSAETDLAKQLTAMSPEDRTKLLMKVALSQPVAVIGQ